MFENIFYILKGQEFVLKKSIKEIFFTTFTFKIFILVFHELRPERIWTETAVSFQLWAFRDLKIRFWSPISFISSVYLTLSFFNSSIPSPLSNPVTQFTFFVHLCLLYSAILIPFRNCCLYCFLPSFLVKKISLW